MTAPFASSLCGYRLKTGHPSTSDANDSLSIELGHALFDALGVTPGAPEIPAVGSAMEAAVAEHLSMLRPDLVSGQSRRALDFDQYQHLDTFTQFARKYKGAGGHLNDVIAGLEAADSTPRIKASLQKLRRIAAASQHDAELVADLVTAMPSESLLRIDITVSDPEQDSRLLVGLSSKWSLRTDRAQDCVSQGSKLVAQRRGHMPHYAVVTMEPRPSMLRIIADGSGSVDCIYHLALPELRSAAKLLEQKRNNGAWSPRTQLERMVSQRRIRAYQELVDEVSHLPSR
ncbi:NgoMIV family type II restriction endonuclease [Rhodococcus sp. BH5]|uniref:NgoMIV family type II restriction endonuclease n=1 Tax=Rhodococcus sp. BH5 TaxID=2871702 RepID=UPI0022CD8885|nr:NgoMIV family type II restriction endonuclease [Rhodococcus sp. BH5]MCZ9633224.1 type II site-specific deoxyribonuclease [Rhodococcus sp. BH5]